MFATAQLAFDFGYRARTHEFLQKEYNRMLAEMELDPKPNAKRYNAKLFTIASDEPMPLRALDALAYNAAVDATIGDPAEKKCRVRTHRLLSQLIAFHAHEYTLESEHISLLCKVWKYCRGWWNGEESKKS